MLMVALTNKLFIAEVKTTSPFGYVSSNSWDELFEYANEYGDMISIHTDERWGGSFKLLARASARTSQPILAKGIHATDQEVEEALSRGASKVLVVGRLPRQDLLLHCLIETNTLKQLVEFEKKATQLVWNSRDLTNGKKKSDDFTTARSVYSGWLCQASNIKTIHDIEESANAFIVGEKLIEFTKLL